MRMRKGSVARASRKQTFAEALDRVRRDRTNIVYRETKGKKPCAVLVPVDDERTLEAIEDVIHAGAAERTLAEIKRSGETPRPYAEVRKALGFE
jgi:antitoxin (DNA-binding transcriptional repressor) of toxin-antitoxin stability system